MAYSLDAFTAANSPGRGSNIGDFVPGKKGGWVPRDHPDAATDTPLGGGGRVTGGDDFGVGGGRVDGGGLLPAGGGSTVGADPTQAGPAGPAMMGLRNASQAGDSRSSAVTSVAPQGASNPNLGQRIYPVAMRQLALLPRVY